LIAGSATLKTLEHVSAQVRRKGAVIPGLGRRMQGAFTSHLIAGSLHNDKTQKLGSFSVSKISIFQHR
jgi:hypothetical protein